MIDTSKWTHNDFLKALFWLTFASKSSLELTILRRCLERRAGILCIAI